MLGTKITPGFLLVLSFARCVIAADSGDDFSNNLFSDLAPLLSLLGEQVTMQFMSQSMGWTDNIILAMAPLGIITIIVSAIRVGGPSWLKALVGRARENLAVVEASLMSSTSKEVCELWNGQAVVRSMGAAPIWEFICLLPEGFWGGEDAKESVPEIMTLDDAIRRGYLEESDSNTRRGSHMVQKAEEGSAHNSSPGLKIIIARNPGADAPNITLNMNDQSGTGGVLWVAVVGTILQLGVLVYSGFATYHPRLMFLKDDRPIVHYAYPCTAVGTFLLVLGMMMCAHVVDSSTEETRYRAGQGSTARMVWLQKAGTVSDQVFGSFAIIARDDRTVVLTSRRARKGSKPTSWIDRTVQALVDAVERLLYSPTVSQLRRKGSQGTAAVSAKQGHTAILASKTVLGVLMGLCGFIVQFIGLRGMHWSASVAQLGATLIMTAFRAWVRLGLAKPAETRQLTSGFELDWLAAALGDPDKAPWLATSVCEEIINDWWITHGASPSRLERQRSESETEPERSWSKAQTLMKIRRDLSVLAKWPGTVSKEAAAVAKSIAIIMDKLIGSQSGDRFTWTLGAHYAGSGDHTIRFCLTHDKKWKVDVQEIEAALSLWLCSANEAGDDARRLHARESHLPTKQNSPSLRLLGPSTPSLRRHLQWWIARDSPAIMEVEVYSQRAVKNGAQGIYPYKILKRSIRSGELPDTRSEDVEDEDGSGWHEVESHRIIGYGITDGDAVQKGREWGNFDGKSSLRGDDDSVYTDTSVTERGEYVLAVTSTEPTKLLYAHAMLSAFMRAVAKEATKRRGEVVTELRGNDTGNFNARRNFILWDSRLSVMAQRIRDTGLGNLSEIYLSIIPPLSAEQHLLEPKEVVTLVKKHAERLGQMGHWKAASDAWFWLLQPANTFPEDGEFYKTARVEATDRRGKGPLHIAALADDSDLAKLLIRNYAEIIDVGSFGGLTALHTAAAYGKEDIVRLLIASGANINATDNEGLPPVYAAAAGKHKVIANLLFENGANKNVTDHSGGTLLHVAASRDKKEAVALFLDIGVEKDAVDDEGCTPLHIAAAGSRAAITRLLLDSGANTEAADGDGQMPLHIAAADLNTTVVELLLDRGADKNARDNEGRTPLHVASPTVGALLIKRGADEHAKDKEGREPVVTHQSQAAQDYQKQLVLLEEQNRKRMMMVER